MPSPYRIFGIELSPYSVKVRSYFRYKALPHEWIVRNVATQAEYQKYAKLPIIPLVVTPDGEGIQDSTPILERFETAHPEPSIHPGDRVAAFVSALLEEFGDEWGNKWMFHYRWAREVDQLCSAGRIARAMMPAATDEQHAGMTAQICERMVNRVWFVGSNAETAPQIEDSFRETIGLLDAHLATRPYLFGARPAFGDFGLWAQLYEAWTDPTPGALIEGRAPHLLDWVHRMLWPRAEGDVRAVVASRADPVAAARAAGRPALPAVDGGERRGDRGRQRRVPRRTRGQELDPEAPEVPRQVACGAAREVRRRRRRSRARSGARAHRMPRGAARLTRNDEEDARNPESARPPVAPGKYGQNAPDG